MKRSSIFAILFGIYFIFLYLIGNHVFLMAGFGIYAIIFGFFEYKNYNNNKLYLAIMGVILIISLIISFIQLLSPLYIVNKIEETVYSILFTLFIIIASYDVTHDHKLFKVQIKDQRPLIKYGIPIIIIITAFSAGILAGIYY